jgi:hypothetical protein
MLLASIACYLRGIYINYIFQFPVAVHFISALIHTLPQTRLDSLKYLRYYIFKARDLYRSAFNIKKWNQITIHRRRQVVHTELWCGNILEIITLDFKV